MVQAGPRHPALHRPLPRRADRLIPSGSGSMRGPGAGRRRGGITKWLRMIWPIPAKYYRQSKKALCVEIPLLIIAWAVLELMGCLWTIENWLKWSLLAILMGVIVALNV